MRALVRLMIDLLWQDTRTAVRTLWKHRGFTVFATVSLALGIGANTALFSLVDRLLLRSLPVSEPDRLVEVQQTISRLGIKKAVTGASPAAFDAVRAHPEIFSAVVGFEYLDRPAVTIGGAVEPPRRLARVSANFFRDLGIQPAVGRVPEATDDAVAVVGDAWWRDRFGASSEALGQAMTVDGRTYTIVGVAPAAFRGLSIDAATDGWIVSRAPTTLQMIARLAPGVGAEQARAAAEVVFRQLAQSQPEAMRWGDDMRTTLVPAGRGLSQLREQYERPLLALSALVVVVLLITCTNVGNLLVLRHAGRRRELAVRVALGAGRARLVLMYVIESLVLALLGGALALAVAALGCVDPALDPAGADDARRSGVSRRRAGAGLRGMRLDGQRTPLRPRPRVAGHQERPLPRAAIEPRTRRHAAQPAARALAGGVPGCPVGAAAGGRGALRADAAQPDTGGRRVRPRRAAAGVDRHARRRLWARAGRCAAAPAARSRRGDPRRSIRHGDPERRDAVGGDAVPRDAPRPRARAGRRVERRRSRPGLLRDDGHSGASRARLHCRGLRAGPAAGGRHRGLGAPLLPWRESSRRRHR